MPLEPPTTGGRAVIIPGLVDEPYHGDDFQGVPKDSVLPDLNQRLAFARMHKDRCLFFSAKQQAEERCRDCPTGPGVYIPTVEVVKSVKMHGLVWHSIMFTMNLAHSVGAEPNKDTIKTYQQLVVSLMYVACGTRPDIAFGVNCCAQFMQNPGESHFKAAKHILQYL